MGKGAITEAPEICPEYHTEGVFSLIEVKPSKYFEMWQHCHHCQKRRENAKLHAKEQAWKNK